MVESGNDGFGGVLAEGARRLLQEALEVEVADHLQRMACRRDPRDLAPIFRTHGAKCFHGIYATSFSS